MPTHETYYQRLPVILYSRNHAASVERGTHIYTDFFEKFNNLTHTAHNVTEVTLNERENA